MRSPGTFSTNRKGPVPTGLSANFSLPTFFTWVGLSIMGSPQLWRIIRSHSAYGLLKVSLRV